ncbi:MAG: fumarate hydratase [Syntrophales bacterium]|nr:fumarate hydratase [Syntrophales bacterium]HPL62127.1 fumarate hydratase [Syntrophales bacterium]
MGKGKARTDGPVREISCRAVADTVSRLFIEANTELPEDVIGAVRSALEREESPSARQALGEVLENAGIARKEKLPLCQDTGLAIVFAELGQDVHITGGDFNSCIQDGVKKAYAAGCLRKSVCDPLSRENTGDNTPAVIHVEIVPGDRLRLIAMPKGGGAENMSAVGMILATSGPEGIRKFVIDAVVKAGPNPCPPVIIGVGIGGSIDLAPILAKRALLRRVGEVNSLDTRIAELESEILIAVNKLGIGPQGLGGKTTALAVHIEAAPCHIASLPVAVSIQCHSARHREATI